MDFDYVAIGIVKEDLVPFDGRRVSRVRVWDAFCFKMVFERFDVIRSISDVASFNRIDGVTGFKPDAQVLLRDVGLNRAISAKGQLACIPFGFLLFWNVDGDGWQHQNIVIKRIHLADIFAAKADMM